MKKQCKSHHWRLVGGNSTQRVSVCLKCGANMHEDINGDIEVKHIKE